MIYAQSNTPFYPDLATMRPPQCRTTGVGGDLLAPDGLPFRLNGLPSEACERAEADGRLFISITATAGHWSPGPREADVPYIIYYAELLTTRADLAADKIVFQRFLDDLVLTPHSPMS